MGLRRAVGPSGTAAELVATVRREADLAHVPARLRSRTVALDAADPVAAVRALAPGGVDRVVEVAFSDDGDLDTAVLRLGGVLAAYATRDGRPSFDFWPLLLGNVTIRLLGSDDLPEEAKQQAAADLTVAAADGDLEVPIAPAFPLAETARAHDQVDADNRRRVLVAVSEGAGRGA